LEPRALSLAGAAGPAHAAQQIVFQEYVRTVTERTDCCGGSRLSCSSSQDVASLSGGRSSAGAARSPIHVAITTIAELGDLTRFDTPPAHELSRLTRVSTPVASGDGSRDDQGRQRSCASVLIEAAKAYRHGRRSPSRSRPPAATAAAIRDIAWRAQLRRCGRYRKRLARASPEHRGGRHRASARPSCGRSRKCGRSPRSRG